MSRELIDMGVDPTDHGESDYCPDCGELWELHTFLPPGLDDDGNPTIADYTCPKLQRVWYLSPDGTIHDGQAVLYDYLDDWLDKRGQQILCDLMNEGWDKTPFSEVEPILNKRLAARDKQE